MSSSNHSLFRFFQKRLNQTAMSSSNHLFIGSIIHWVSMDEMEVLTDGFVAVQDGKVISKSNIMQNVIHKHVI